MDMEDIDCSESISISAVKEVEEITQDMERGAYESDSDYSGPDTEEEDPRIVEMYDMACGAVGWKPPATYQLPT